eukprot:8960038-Pyramimonas_sp.AAC.1
MHRHIEQARAGKDSELSAVLLDWSKAFDWVGPSALLIALGRFGLTDPCIKMIAAIYDGRAFEVKDERGCSNRRAQCSGAQGCPLS